MGVAATVTSSRSLSVSWNPPDRSERNGIIRHYYITLLSDFGAITRNISSMQRSIIISGLRPYTQYNCTVQAETVALGPTNDVIQVSTPQDGKNDECVSEFLLYCY